MRFGREPMQPNCARRLTEQFHTTQHGIIATPSRNPFITANPDPAAVVPRNPRTIQSDTELVALTKCS